MGIFSRLKQTQAPSLPADYDQPADDDQINLVGTESVDGEHLVYGRKANGRKVLIEKKATAESAASTAQNYRRAYFVAR